VKLSYCEFEKFKIITQNLFEKYLNISTYVNYIQEKNKSILGKNLKNTGINIDNFNSKNYEKSMILKYDNECLSKEISYTTNNTSNNNNSKLVKKDSFNSISLDLKDKEIISNKIYHNKINNNNNNKEINDQVITQNNLNEEAFCTICEINKQNLALSCLVSHI
jgi:hypothetical protein